VISILGAGPHGKQLAELLKFEHGCTLYDDYLPDYKPVTSAPARDEYLIGAVWPHVRQLINDKVGLRSPFNYGRIIFPHVFIGFGVELGEHVHVMHAATISHGCQVGDFVTICAGARLNGEVTVESGAFIGAGAVVRHGGLTIGKGATIGMGAVVVDDVPPGEKWVGNPARPLVKP
jgi:acetyltransferase-like isoleucine patch superfamily enzyme